MKQTARVGFVALVAVALWAVGYLLGVFSFDRAVALAPSLSSTIAIGSLSTDPSRVTGGDGLIEIAVARGGGTGKAWGHVTLEGRDVTSAFRAISPTTYQGLVTGLVEGRNTLAATTADGTAKASIEITNYPI